MPLDEKHEQDLRVGIDAINRKKIAIDTAWQYYNDIQPPKFLNQDMAKRFKNLQDRFSLNLCRLAVATPLNRLWVESWEDERIQRTWDQLQQDREQKRIYKHAMVAGESYSVGWKGSRLRSAFNDARIIHLFYKIDEPHVKDFAVKVWQERDGTFRATIYYEDNIVRLVGSANQKSYRDRYLEQVKSPAYMEAAQVMAASFEYDPEDPGGPHDMGEVPVWRFSPDLWLPESRLRDLIPIQDAINKLRSNKMVASESNAYPQRVYFTMQDLNKDDLENDPNTALVLDPGDRESPASVQQFEASDLRGYDAAISAEIQNFFTVAHLPRHLLISPGADSSGDAIRSDEGPFQEMVRDIATNFGYTWSDMMTTLAGVDEPVLPDWQDARINNAESQAREFKMLVESGMPTAYAAKKAFQWSVQEALDAGLSEQREEVVQNLSDRSEASPRTQTTEDEPQ